MYNKGKLLMQKIKLKKVLLIILDGFGLRGVNDFNAVANANTPNLDFYMKNYALGTIDASGAAVGLPDGQFGNSEVGHLNIGAGRVVEQDITRIDNAIKSGEFFTKKEFVATLDNTISHNVHIMGLLSDGGVHSHINHIFALIKLVSANTNINKVWLHLFLDGRDTPPESAIKYANEINAFLKDYSKVSIATCSGRYYAMDRDKRYDRLELAYKAITLAHSDNHSNDIISCIKTEYAKGHKDEFVLPYVIDSYSGFVTGDSVIFANFRSDRAIQLTDAFLSDDFVGFERVKPKLSGFVTMTSYDPKFNAVVAFKQNTIENCLGEYISNLGLKQLRISETEKYPHVTYFFNGGLKAPFSGEDRILVDSPKDVATYDLKPEMSLPIVTDKLVDAIKSDKYDFIMTNFANGDMVGHSGNYEAAIKAVEALDLAVGRSVSAMTEMGGEVLIIADHGNCEEMFDYVSNQQHTQHTTNLVPFIYIGRDAKIKSGGALRDVAPSILAMSGLDYPPEMNGHSLIEFK
jgi:2,3-bisphosphoglycerate-independent phosphoglycerate mutase